MNKSIFLSVIVFLLLLPVSADARYKDDVAAWIPWWLEEEEVAAVTENIDELDIVYPFIYEIEGGGKIVAKVDIEKGEWEDLLDEADDEHVDIIPTIAWFDGEAIHAVLSDRKLRQRLVKNIDNLVDDNNFDGINIDFEQKWSDTYDYFAEFLEELEDELGHDELTCAIEARTPAEDLYREVPEPLEYANDYYAINKYCDEIQLMTYDQQRADLTLNDERRGVPYSPIADIDWVEKVVEFALEDFDEDKVMLGIPTYGRAWDVTVAPEWYREYTRIASVNYSRIEELEEIYDVERGRTEGGEGIITYFPEDSVWKIFDRLPTPEGTPVGYEAAAKALLVATYANVEIPVRILTFGDSEAAKDKLDLAEKYDLKGVAFFSLNSHEDPTIWNLF